MYIVSRGFRRFQVSVNKQTCFCTLLSDTCRSTEHTVPLRPHSQLHVHIYHFTAPSKGLRLTSTSDSLFTATTAPRPPTSWPRHSATSPRTAGGASPPPLVSSTTLSATSSHLSFVPSRKAPRVARCRNCAASLRVEGASVSKVQTPEASKQSRPVCVLARGRAPAP